MSGDRSARKAPSPVPDPRRKNRLVINEINNDSIHFANVFPTLTAPQNRRPPRFTHQSGYGKLEIFRKYLPCGSHTSLRFFNLLTS